MRHADRLAGPKLRGRLTLSIESHYPLGVERGLAAAFHFDADHPDCLIPLVELIERLQREARADARPGWYRRGEAHAVQPVIDAHLEIAADLEAVVRQAAQHRQRQEAVRDGAAKRRLLPGALYILMDPLVIAGDVRERVDARLLHGEPIAHRYFVANQGLQFFDSFYNAHSGQRKVRRCGSFRCGTPLKLNSIRSSSRSRMVVTAELYST